MAGFDDASFARFAWPPLTTVRQPIVEVAQLATEIVLQRLHGQEGDDNDHLLQSLIVRRASTGKAS